MTQDHHEVHGNLRKHPISFSENSQNLPITLINMDIDKTEVEGRPHGTGLSSLPLRRLRQEGYILIVYMKASLGNWSKTVWEDSKVKTGLELEKREEGRRRERGMKKEIERKEGRKGRRKAWRTLMLSSSSPVTWSPLWVMTFYVLIRRCRGQLNYRF